MRLLHERGLLRPEPRLRRNRPGAERSSQLVEVDALVQNRTPLSDALLLAADAVSNDGITAVVSPVLDVLEVDVGGDRESGDQQKAERRNGRDRARPPIDAEERGDRDADQERGEPAVGAGRNERGDKEAEPANRYSRRRGQPVAQITITEMNR